MLSGFGFYHVILLNPALYFLVWHALGTLPHTLSLIPSDQHQGWDCRTLNIWFSAGIQSFHWNLHVLVWVCQPSLTLVNHGHQQNVSAKILIDVMQVHSLFPKPDACRNHRKKHLFPQATFEICVLLTADTVSGCHAVQPRWACAWAVEPSVQVLPVPTFSPPPEKVSTLGSAMCSRERLSTSLCSHWQCKPRLQFLSFAEWNTKQQRWRLVGLWSGQLFYFIKGWGLPKTWGFPSQSQESRTGWSSQAS